LGTMIAAATSPFTIRLARSGPKGVCGTAEQYVFMGMEN
jgi:hypothetical protein